MALPKGSSNSDFSSMVSKKDKGKKATMPLVEKEDD